MRARPVALVFGLLVAVSAAMQACGGDEAQTACGSSADCGTGQLCNSYGVCVADDGSSSSSSGGNEPDAKAICQDYLDCLAQVDPGSVAESLGIYGADGSCWSGGAATQDTCETACREGMKGWHFFEPDACPECYADTHCDLGGCESGSCVVRLAVPETSSDCADCAVTAANQSGCQDDAEACANSAECVALAACVGGCASDATCVADCYASHQGALLLYDDGFGGGYAPCVMCGACTGVCNPAKWCPSPP